MLLKYDKQNNRGIQIFPKNSTDYLKDNSPSSNKKNQKKILNLKKIYHHLYKKIIFNPFPRPNRIS
jgi:hypothetical protein